MSSAARPCHTYSLLTIGDGLVSQIPALLLSVSTGLIVTRASDPGRHGHRRPRQISAQPRAAADRRRRRDRPRLVPGLPKIPFLLVGVGAVRHRAAALRDGQGRRPRPRTIDNAPAPSMRHPRGDPVALSVDPLELVLAADLIDLVDAQRGGDLLDRVRGAAAQARRRARRGHAAGAHPRQPRPAPVDVRGPHQRRRGGRRPPPAGHVLAIGDGLAALPGQAPASRSSGWPASGSRPSCASRPSCSARPSSTARR